MFRFGDVPETQEGFFNPTRLNLARRTRGLTKTQLAGRVGVDLRAVSAYEAGEYQPASETIRRLATALKFPDSFFFGDDLDEPMPDGSSFRSMSRMTSAQRDMALGAGAIALYLNKWLESKFELPVSQLPDLGREPDPEAAAESLRRYWGIGELPIRNMIHLLELNGVRVFSLAIKTRQLDAFSLWKNETPFVFLNTCKTAEHSRFDAAHELGHLVLHRHGAPNGREAERQADMFASAFLMPRASLRAYPVRLPNLETLKHLKKIWNVSVAALNYRLHQVRLIGDWHYQGLCKEIAKHGYRVREPNEGPRETSQVLAKAMLTLHREGITRSDIARALSILPSELEQLIFGLVMTGIDGGKPLTERAAISGPLPRQKASLMLIKG
jgi:Zn-dependent peptidase ImmA (M78 family)/DNA-binding XRE family transcriptional regulator